MRENTVYYKQWRPNSCGGWGHPAHRDYIVQELLAVRGVLRRAGQSTVRWWSRGADTLGGAGIKLLGCDAR